MAHPAIGNRNHAADTPVEPASAVGGATGDDAALVRRARDDPDAFAELYRRHVDGVYRFCAARLGSRQEAEDATSRAFLVALARLDQCRPESFRGWLFTVARSQVHDGLRARARSLPLDGIADVADRRAGPERTAEDAEAEAALRAALARLPAGQREVVALRLAGLDHEEIAAVLGKRNGAVRISFHRAAARLRSLWPGMRSEEVGR
jgi:RNA polymerase sigma-70 factor (ECF subfamily)